MKKAFPVLLVLLLFYVVSFSQNISLEKLRKEFHFLNTDSVQVALLEKEALLYKGNDNTILCYKGAISAAMAKHSSNNKEKMQKFKDGKNQIEQCIAKDSNNVELRFLRYTIQTNSPKVLGYNKQAPADKKYILANLNSVKDATLRRNIDAVMNGENRSKTPKNN